MLLKYLNSMDEITISPEDDTSTFELISSWFDRHLYRIAQTLQQLSDQEEIFQKHVVGNIMQTSKIQQEIKQHTKGKDEILQRIADVEQQTKGLIFIRDLLSEFDQVKMEKFEGGYIRVSFQIELDQSESKLV